MLELILKEIQTNGVTSAVILAERLNTTPQLVRAMLATLERMGYLSAVESDCEEKPCGSCPVAGYCSTGENMKPRVLVLK